MNLTFMSIRVTPCRSNMLDHAREAPKTRKRLRRVKPALHPLPRLHRFESRQKKVSR